MNPSRMRTAIRELLLSLWQAQKMSKKEAAKKMGKYHGKDHGRDSTDGPA